MKAIKIEPAGSILGVPMFDISYYHDDGRGFVCDGFAHTRENAMEIVQSFHGTIIGAEQLN